jgi:riboflavin synthase
MFTGLVEALGQVVSTRPEQGGLRLVIEQPAVFADQSVGASIAVNGCCLTILRLYDGRAEFQAGPETLAKTNLGALRVGERVNLERSMSAAGRFGGHIVLGHVDGVATIAQHERNADWQTTWFHAGPLVHGIVSKGSVAVDGVSLTVVDVAAESFSVALIPHTLEVTTLGIKPVGATVNVETDVIGKYVQRYIDHWRAGLSFSQLREAGFIG